MILVDSGSDRAGSHLPRRGRTTTLPLGGSRRGFAFILSGGVGAQLIAVGALPILSRLYTPAEFGRFTLILALAALVAPAATLRFETAAMLPDRIDEVRALVWNSLAAAVIVSILYGILLHLLSLLAVDDPTWTPFLPLWVFLTVLMAAGFAVFSQLSLRKQQYALVARRTLFRSLATAVSQTGLGFIGRTGDGLIVGATIGSAIGISSMISRTREFLPFPGLQPVRAVWRMYWRFPAVFAPSALLNSAGMQAPVVFFTLVFGLSAGGQLGMAERIVTVPLVLVGAAVAQVIDADISKRLREGGGGLLRTYLRLSLPLAALGSVVAVALGLLGGWAIPWFLGEQWALAGQMIQVLAVPAGIRLVASPLSRFLILLQKSLANFILDVIRVALMTATMAIVLIYSFDILPAVLLVYMGLSVTYIITWAYGVVLVRNHDRGA